MKAINLNNGQVLAWKVQEAFTFFKRLRGLLFTRNLCNGGALYIQPCSSVHTFFMNYSIDILYLDADQTIIGMDENLQPGHMGRKFIRTVSVVELPSGKIKETETQLGHSIKFENF